MLVFCWVALIGLGSAAFHCTLRFVSQAADEIPMIAGALQWWFVVYAPAFKSPRARVAFGTLLAIAGASYSVWHLATHPTVAFQVTFGTLAFGALPGVRSYLRGVSGDDPAAARLARWYVASGLCAFAAWLLDNSLCASLHQGIFGLPYPHGHAMWHVLMGANCYFGATFAAFAHAVRCKRAPQLRWLAGIAPVVELRLVNTKHA